MDLMSLVATLSLDATQFTDGIQKATGSFGGLNAASVAVGNLLSQGFNTAVTSVKNFAGFVMDSGTSFESTMSQVQAISGATGGQLDALTSKAQEMGSKTKFSATESAEAFTYMAMAGWDTEQMLNGIEGVMNLAAASGEDLASVSDIVTDALTAFGLKAEDSAHFADLLATASSNSNTNVGMMGETFKYVAPVAGALGMDADDVAVAIGLMANAGIKGSQAGTSLRSTFTKLLNPTKESQKIMDALGFSIEDSNHKMKPFDQILSDLRSTFGNLDETQKAQYASTLVGQEAMSGLLAIVNASDEDYQKLTTAIKNCDGAAEEMSGVMQNNLTGAMTILQSNVEGLALAFYDGISGTAKTAVEGLQGAITKVTDKVTAWIQSDSTQEKLANISDKIGVLADKLVDNLDPILDGVVGLFDKLVDIITYGIEHFDEIAGVIGTVVTAFVGLKAAMGALKIISMISQIASLIAAMNPVTIIIGAIVAAIAVLITHWDQVKEVAQKAWEGIKKAWQSAGQWFSGIVENIKQAFSGIVDGISKFFSQAWEKVKGIWDAVTGFFAGIVAAVINAFTSIPSKISDFFDKAGEKVRKIWDAILEFFGKLVSNVIKAFTDIPNKVSEFFRSAYDKVTQIWQAVTGWFQEKVAAVIKAFTDIPSKISKFFSDAWGKVQSAWDGARSWFDGVSKNVSGTFSGISSTIGGYFQSAWSAVQQAWSNVGSFFQGVRETIKGALSNLGEQARSWGSDMINGFKNGIENAKSGLQKAASGVANTIKKIFHFSRPDEGPLREYEQWMPDFMAGMASGIERNTWRLQEASLRAATAMADAFNTSGNVNSPVNAVGAGNGSAGNVNNYTISINVNGAQYSDENALVQKISFELQNMLDRRKAVFA